jgi:hypothetical protein
MILSTLYQNEQLFFSGSINNDLSKPINKKLLGSCTVASISLVIAASDAYVQSLEF